MPPSGKVEFVSIEILHHTLLHGPARPVYLIKMSLADIVFGLIWISFVIVFNLLIIPVVGAIVLRQTS